MTGQRFHEDTTFMSNSNFATPVPVVARVTLEVPVLPSDAVAGERKRNVPVGEEISLDADLAAELVASGAVAYVTPRSAQTAILTTPLEGDALLQAIGQAMRDIDPVEGLTAEGKVSLYALETVLGFRPSADERDLAQETYGEKRPDLFTPIEGDEDELAPVVAAIDALDPDNPSFWTAGGQPDLRALAEVLGRRVSADERDAAMARRAERTA
jgi:hypothetical protein